jgi:hypothetical protein
MCETPKAGVSAGQGYFADSAKPLREIAREIVTLSPDVGLRWVQRNYQQNSSVKKVTLCDSDTDILLISLI